MVRHSRTASRGSIANSSRKVCKFIKCLTGKHQISIITTGLSIQTEPGFTARYEPTIFPATSGLEFTAIRRMVSGTMSALLSPRYWIRPLDCLSTSLSCWSSIPYVLLLTWRLYPYLRVSKSLYGSLPRGDDLEDWTIGAWFGSSESTDHVGVQWLRDDWETRRWSPSHGKPSRTGKLPAA